MTIEHLEIALDRLNEIGLFFREIKRKLVIF